MVDAKKKNQFQYQVDNVLDLGQFYVHFVT